MPKRLTDGRRSKGKTIARRKLASLWRYRPRVLTVALLVVIAALIVLANLSFDVRGANGDCLKLQEIMRHGIRQLSYGWPLVWHRYTLAFSLGPSGVVAWQYHPGRLAANVAIWLAILAAPAGVCEWLLRRYRPRLLWSLRTMLAAVALAAMLCAWFVAARSRMNLQDELMATIRGRDGYVWIERRGPRWLGLVGADRFRQHVFAAQVGRTLGDDLEYEQEEEDDLQLLRQLLRLPDLQYLDLEQVDCLTVAMVDELNRFPRLRALSIDLDHLTEGADEALAKLAEAKQLRSLVVDADDAGDETANLARQCLKCIGKISQLEELELSSPFTDAENLDCLANLTNLKSLKLYGIKSDSDDSDSEPPLLRRLPVLPQLEALHISAKIGGRDLRCLAMLPRLKSLALTVTMAKPAEIAELAASKSLEELEIAGYGEISLVSPEGLGALQSLKRLKKLRIAGFQSYSSSPGSPPQEHLLYVAKDKLDDCLRAIDALRQSNPGIVIENDPGMGGGSSQGHWNLLPDYDTTEGIENSVKAMLWLPPTMKPTVPGGIEDLEW